MTDEEMPKSNQHLNHRPSGNLKLKMLVLVGMLLMVVYAMHEAGKPENWQWMNFPKDTPARPLQSPATSGSNRQHKFEPAQKSGPGLTNRETKDATTNQPIRLANLPPAPNTHQRKSEIPAESAVFWQRTFAAISSEQQFLLIEILDQLQTTDRVNQTTSVTKQQNRLIEKIIQRRAAFDDRLLDRMTSLPSSSQEKSRASEDYFESDSFWNKNISVALKAFVDNLDITLTQQRQVMHLKRFLENEALNLVQDDTAVGWIGDSLAWNRSWKRIHSRPRASPKQVTRIQLVAQPNEYRGQLVTIRGYVRAIESRTANPGTSIMPNGEPGQYSIAWIKPLESQAGPYCVYCYDVPAHLPDDNQQLKNFDALATIDGIFFKNRSYPAASGEVLSCPLILASNFTLQPTNTNENSSLFWQPSRTTMFMLAWIVPLVAIGGTWLIFRAADTRKRLPSPLAEQKLSLFLTDLKQDPSVQTDLQKVQAISERESEIE